MKLIPIVVRVSAGAVDATANGKELGVPIIRATYDHGQLTALMQRATLARIGSNNRALGEGVRDGAERIRTRAVRNLSGYPVTYTGGAFRVQVRTGALKGAVEAEWPYGDALTARVFINGAHTSTTNVGGYPGKPVSVSRYAGAIEHGHKEIDLKKTMLGKTVPFFGARAQNATGPYAATGLRKSAYLTQDSEGVLTERHAYKSEPFDAKLRALGKRPMNFARKRSASGGAYFIAFRKVGKKGWIIPEAKARPFMAAAAQASTVDVQRIIGGKVRAVLAER
jgi:hypothetical protein